MTTAPDTSTQATSETLSPAEVIRWHLDAGVDEAIAEVPQNRFNAAQVAAPVVPKASQLVKPATPKPHALAQNQNQNQNQNKSEFTLPTPNPALTTPAPLVSMAPVAKPSLGFDQALKTAVKVAAAAKTLDELKSALDGFDGCGLKKTATNLVFGDGNPDAKLVLMGEAPGGEEDRQGTPFAGTSGQLLDKMLASINMTRDEIYISNTVFWRPPGNRSPNASEVSICQPFVERMIELIDPEILITVGGPATHSLLAQKGSISRLRGNWFLYETPRMSRPIQATAIYHPDYLLETPAMKRPTWSDLLEIRKKFDAIK